MAEARPRRATRAGVAWRRGSASVSTRGQSLASVDMAAGARLLRASGRGHLRPDGCGEGERTQGCRAGPAGCLLRTISSTARGGQHGGVRTAAATSKTTKVARFQLALVIEGSEGRVWSKQGDAGIHQINRFDFGFVELRMNTGSAHHVLDESSQ